MTAPTGAVAKHEARLRKLSRPFARAVPVHFRPRRPGGVLTSGASVVNGQKVLVVLPAYNAEKTLERTLADVPPGVVDEFLLVDDASVDATVVRAASLGLPCLVHPRNRGYGG